MGAYWFRTVSTTEVLPEILINWKTNQQILSRYMQYEGVSFVTDLVRNHVCLSHHLTFDILVQDTVTGHCIIFSKGFGETLFALVVEPTQSLSFLVPTRSCVSSIWVAPSVPTPPLPNGARRLLIPEQMKNAFARFVPYMTLQVRADMKINKHPQPPASASAAAAASASASASAASSSSALKAGPLLPTQALPPAYSEHVEGESGAIVVASNDKDNAPPGGV